MVRMIAQLAQDRQYQFKLINPCQQNFDIVQHITVDVQERIRNATIRLGASMEQY